MKWLAVQPGPDFSVHDVYVGWTEALRDLGERVHVYNMGDRLTFYDAIAIETGRRDDDGHPEFRKALTHEQAINISGELLLAAAMAHCPDVLLVVSGFFTPPMVLDICRARGIKVVMLHTEAPYEDQRQLELSAHVDVSLLNDPVSLDKYRDVCPVAEYAPHAYRPSVHYPRRPAEQAWDLAFSGTGYESRIAFFEAMNLNGLRVALAGNWVQLPEGSTLRRHLVHGTEECLDNELTADLYQASRAGINMYRREADEGAVDGVAMGPREVEMAACGLFFLRDPRPEGDTLLPMLPTFSSPAEAGDELRWWLEHDSVRDKAAASARQAVTGRTFRANAEMLLRILDRQPVTI